MSEVTWQDFKTLEEFAEHVHGVAHKLMALGGMADNMRIVNIAGDLCTLASSIHNQGKMAREVETSDTYDLSALPRPDFRFDGVGDGDEGDGGAVQTDDPYKGE